MNSNEKIFDIVDIMLRKCKNHDVDYYIDLTKNIIDDVEKYELLIISSYQDGPFDAEKSLLISFYFGDVKEKSYVSLNYSDNYRGLVKLYLSTHELKNRYSKLVKCLYDISLDIKVRSIYDRCEEDFDITKSDIRELKIEKIIK